MPTTTSALAKKVIAWLPVILVSAVLILSGGPAPATTSAMHAEPSATPTATLPPSATPTRTATVARDLPTPRPTASPTPLPPAASPTATATPSPTASPSPAATATPTPEPSPTPLPTAAIGEDVVNILLIGGDNNYVPDMNTDTLIVAVVNRKTRQVSLLSIPRDLWVNIPTYGMGRINIAHRIGARFKYPDGGGPGLLMRTIEENLGIGIDHWVRIGYDGFARAVDEVGGVDMVVPCRVNLRYRPPTSQDEEEIILEAGIHHFDGATALRYVRTRRNETDFERESRQQQFIKRVWYQFKSASVLPKVPALWSAMKGAFATDLKLGDILALAPAVLDLEPQRIRSRFIGRGQVQSWTTPGGAQVLLPIPEKIQPLVESLYAPPPAPEQPAAEPLRIQVQNGTRRPDLAAIAVDQLRWYGLHAEEGGPAEQTGYEKTQILVFGGEPGAVEKLAHLLKVGAENVVEAAAQDPALDVRVILGADYDPCRP